VFQLVARVAKRNAVGHIEAKLRVLSERLDVMSTEITSALVTALLALVAVALEDRGTPLAIKVGASVV